MESSRASPPNIPRSTLSHGVFTYRLYGVRCPINSFEWGNAHTFSINTKSGHSRVIRLPLDPLGFLAKRNPANTADKGELDNRLHSTHWGSVHLACAQTFSSHLSAQRKQETCAHRLVSGVQSQRSILCVFFYVGRYIK